MNITDFLTRDQVLIIHHATDKLHLLQGLASRAAWALGIDADKLTSALLKREELGSTGMGAGMRFRTPG